MQTGRPKYYIPSLTTVSQDVKKVFINVQKQMEKMLQVRNSQVCTFGLG